MVASLCRSLRLFDMPEAFKLLAGPQLWSLNCLAMLSVGQGPQCLPDLGKPDRANTTWADWVPLPCPIGHRCRMHGCWDWLSWSLSSVHMCLRLSLCQELYLAFNDCTLKMITTTTTRSATNYDDPPDSEADDPFDSGSEETEPELLMTQRHQKLQRIGETVLSLKSLYQVSGRAYLLLFGMAESLVKWQRFDYKEYSMSSFDYEAHKFLWLKPDAL